VTFQGEDVFAGPEDGLDALADGGEVQRAAGLVFAQRTGEQDLEFIHRRGELPPRVALVADHDVPAVPRALGEKFKTHLPFVPLGRGETEGPGRPVRGEDGVQAKTPEVAGMGGAVPVVGRVREGRAPRGLPTAPALDRGRVDEHEVVVVPGALLGEHPEQPVQGVGEGAATLVVARLPRDLREEVAQVLAGIGQEAPVRRDSRDGLGHAESDDLGVGRPPSGVAGLLWQKVIGCAINVRAESVEVGVHRGLRVDGVLDTADFGLSALSSFPEVAISVESII